uniref:hypothetical protein n=1 Tax=Thermus sp. 4C TaxID=446041 RepID=UPI0015630813|nr:hypothetical protein [Thermus sp. 4C]
MDQNKSFLQDLYKALFQDNEENPEAQDRDPKTPTPPDGEAKNPVQDGLTYTSPPKGCFPQNSPKALSVGGSTSPRTTLPVGDVCKGLPDGPRKLLELLQEIALGILPPGNRDLRRKVGTVVFLLPLEMVALHLGITRQTVWAWKKELEATGLIATDVLYSKVDGKDRALGTLWAVRLRPGKARLTRDDYLHPWRNLGLDISNGILSYRWVQAHKERGIQPTLDTLVLWAQGKRVVPNTKSVAVDLGLILVLPELEEAKLPMMITLLGTYLSQVFDDHLSRRFYAGLMWSVARGELPAQFVFSLIVRTLRDYKDGLVSRPGAYIVRALKAMDEPAA